MNYYHLTTPQQNIWNLQKYYDDTAVSNLCGAIFYKEKRDTVKLQQAVCQFIQSQSGIRLRFRDESMPMQYVSEEAISAVDIPVMEFSTREDFEYYAESVAKEPIGLAEGAMYRFVIFQMEGRSGVLAVLSHLVADAWTFGLMANRVDEAYRKLEAGEDVSLQQGDYTEFVQAQEAYFASERYQKDKAFWEEKTLGFLKGTQAFEKSPVKLSAVPAESIAAERITRVLPLPLEQKIMGFCKKHSVTPAVLFETAIMIYLAKNNRENRTITLGMPVLNRSSMREKSIAGMFISTMPLTVEVGGELSALELAERIARGNMEIFRHQKYPYANILKALRGTHHTTSQYGDQTVREFNGKDAENISGNLYDVMVSYQNAKADTGADTKWYSNGYSEVPLTVHIDNRDGNECHTLNVDYQTKVFRREEVQYLIDRLEYILEQIAEDGSRSIKDICIVPEREFKKVTEKFNDTKVDYPRDKCVHELFEEQAARTPERTALVFENREFTYRQLDEMSNSMAFFLREKGVNAGDKVAVLLKRDEKVIISQLAVLKLGAVFIPVDYRYPKDRIEYILSESNARIIVKNRDNIISFPIECVIEDWNPLYVKKFVSVHVSPANTCYIIFTSGSTGKPKGCTLTNYGIVNFCKNLNSIEKCNRLEQPVCVSVNTISFDMFIAESLFPLVNGYTVALANEKESVNQEQFSDLVARTHANIIQTTPTRYKLFFSKRDNLSYAKQFKVIVVSGEELSLDLLKTFVENTDATIYNPLGPSECTVYVVGGELHIKRREVTAEDITIGRPLANNQIYILDQNNNPVPIGVAGELCVAGDNVGNGYLNRPELTAERFVKNPFATEENGHGKVMYHIGDLARWKPDGVIEYLGRIDTQVKIRGLRIELGEIESVMAGFPGIALCAAADKRDETGRQYLVGYYTTLTKEDSQEKNSRQDTAGIDEKALREHLSTKLPKYMVPNYFMHLDTMPMTPSGKTDRKNLPLPDFAQQQEEYTAPETKTEEKLAGIWKELLKLPRVGRTDDFFEMGGDSLLAISLLAEIETAFSVEISVKDVMEKPTLERLALCIEEQCKHQAERIKPMHMDRYVLLPQQKAIYAACQKEPDTLAYNMPTKIALPHWLDRERLKSAIRHVMERTRILKSYVAAEADEIYGVYDEEAEIRFEDDVDVETGFIRPFDLGKAPLFRVGFTEDAMLFDIHHIITDGESLNIILRDIARAYEGQELPEQKLWFGDYAEYFQRQDFTEHKNYFREMLKCDFEKVELPRTKEVRPGGKSLFYQIPQEIMSLTRKYAEENRLTDTMVFLGAYGILLSKYTAKKDILSGIILRNRIHGDVKDMAGMFVNTLPVHLAADGDTAEYFDRVKDIVLNLFRYQELPFWKIANAAGMTDKTVVNTSFVYQADGEKKLVLDGGSLSPRFCDTGTAKFDFSMELTPLSGAENNASKHSDVIGCQMRLEYDCGKYDRDLMDDLAAAYIRILEQLTEKSITDISVLSDGMYHKVTEEFNDTKVDYPRDKCVHELFEEQAARTPERTALVFENREFTYRQLDEMSNSLAHFLREKGIKRGDVVPIISKRSWHIVAAMLGILKAGAAYMPVSPDYPKDRITNIMDIARCRIALLYDYKGKDELQRQGVRCVDLECFNFAESVAPIANVNQPEDLCYAIFTSGSTGTPKGVSVSHRNVANYCSNNNNNNVCHHLIKKEYKSIVSVTNIVFDIFVTETLLPLLNGITIYFADDEEAMSQDRLAALVDRNSIEVMQTTPTRMRSYMLDKGNTGYLRKFKAIILGGEAFPADLYTELRKCTDAHIFNIYGPAETTVWSTNAEIIAAHNEEATAPDITIGKPIANTQIYILDSDSNPLPIGVAGELCIAGDGVGLGYLNRPELTAERFVPNPFATVENGHGRIMYHTGDLARWRADGEIEYLGRIDTQVKIRGLRIELGEIESVMAGFPGIALCAAADKKDETGRQYLVGYYTTLTKENSQEKNRRQDTAGIDEKALREHLSTKLPKYMVPNYFMHLDTMPMTPSGKTDRKNLPLPDFAQQQEEYAAPETDRERTLCRLLESLLGMKRVGAEDDFFAYGGDSLMAIEYVAKAHDAGIDFSLQSVFDYPTVRSLCRHLDAGIDTKVCYEPSEFEKYRKLLAANVVDEEFVPEKRSLGNVLLTGATGFLGAHVLDCLMREETGGREKASKVYCLVRGSGERTPGERLREILSYYFGSRYKQELGHRIIPVVGDIEDERLCEKLPGSLQTVIHTAASVKHYGSYEYFHRVNCEGTRNVAAYAKAVGARLIHISTVSVSGNSMADDFSVYRSEEEKHFYETCLYIGQPLDNVYIHSKFEAERAVYDAMLSGLDAKIIRVGNLTNRLSDFKFQPNYKENAFLTRVKAVLEFGMFPDYLMSLYSEFSPVNKTAEGIVKIAQYADKQCVFHLNSNRPIYFTRLLEVADQLGIPMRIVEGSEFHEALKRTMKSAGTEYIYEAFQNDMDGQGRLVYDSNIRIENDFTVWFLKKTGFEWNETDLEYIRGYVEYFRGLGYLKV